MARLKELWNAGPLITPVMIQASNNESGQLRPVEPDQQTARVIAGITDTKYNTILVPPSAHSRKKPVPDDSFIAVGFDTEFGPDHKLLSIQYSSLREGKIESTVIYRDSLTKESLLKDVTSFLGGASLPSLIILISHFAQVEVSHITNALKDFDIHTFNRALEASTEYEFRDPEPDQYISGEVDLAVNTKLKIIDLYGFVPSALEKIGKSLGFEKSDIGGIGGKPETYWKRHMDEFLGQYPREFDRYARRDAEVALHAWVRLRTFNLGYGIDVLNYHTTAGLALAIFRTKYLPSWEGVGYTAPVFEFAEPYHRKDKTDKWVTSYRNRKFLRNDWRIVRDHALRAYWGGNAQSFGRGIFEEPFSYYDVDSLYPSSAALQPLPNAATKWVTFDTLASTVGLEGYADISFRFPKGTFYPSLPVCGFKTTKLYFPLAGTTSVTLSEVREAQRLGAEITKISGIGFTPSESEVNHPVRNFAIEFLRLKRESAKGSYERDLYKLILNALIGKFAERKKDMEVGELLSFFQKGDMSAADVAAIYKVRARARAWRNPPGDVGSGWWVEAASLILGKARALMSQFVSKGAYFTATDSVLLPRGVSIDCDALTALRSVGSDLKLEASPDKAWLMRTKVYVLWEKGAPVKFARHAIPVERDENFLNWVELSLRKGHAVPFKPRRTHIISIKDVVTKGKSFGSSEVMSINPSTGWDNKRDPRGFTIDLFSGKGTLFPPHQEMPEKMASPGRPRNPEVDRIIAATGINREAAKKRLSRNSTNCL